MTKKKEIGVAVIGMGWMGGVHARSFSQHSRLSDLPLVPRLVVVADENEARLKWAKEAFGFEHAMRDWQKAIAHPDVELVSITAPTYLHAQMVCAAAAAGKHVYCEKPAGRVLSETQQAASAVAAAGVLSACGYNYRHLPVVQFCKKLQDEGRLGATQHFNAKFLSMYGSDPLSPLSWRFRQAYAGHGAISDILSHAIDMAHFFAGNIARVQATKKTFISERPLPSSSANSHYAKGNADSPMGAVENDDYVCVLVEYNNGAVGQLQASRVALGPKSEMGFSFYGSNGSATWDFERMNELQLYLPDDENSDAARDGYTRILGGGAHYGQARINPGDGNGIGYEDSKLLEAVALLCAIADENPAAAQGMQQALQVAQVNDAVLRSCDSGTWQAVRY